jgi:hypothetical protein
MILDVLFALGLLLSTASQLRPQGAPIGPGEICLVVWLILTLFREAGRLGPRLTPALSRLLIFWSVFAFSLSLGTLAGYAIGDVHDSNLFLHDVMAYPLLAAVGCFSVIGREPGRRLHRVAWLFLGFGTAALVIQVAGAWEWLDIAPLEPWYWDRLRGWSANPQQLALLCAVIGLLALHLADAATRIGERIAALAGAIVAIYVGRLTKSDSFSVVLVVAGPIFAGLKLGEWLLSSEPKLTVRTAFAWTLVLCLPLLVISTVPLGPSIAARAEDLARELSKDSKGKTSQEEAELRFHNWGEAVNRGLESGMLGLGPGPHLEIPASIVNARRFEYLPKYIETPPLNGSPNFEAHNTPLDLFTQGGLIAVLSFMWITATALFNAYKARLAGLTTLLCGLTIFGLGNLIIRHPIFWFAVVLCLASNGTRTALPVRNGR